MAKSDTQLSDLFSALPLDEMTNTLASLTVIRDNAVNEKRAELLAQLEALGGIPASSPKRSSKPGDGRSSPKAKYRSLKDPALVWSGRGQTAAWLKAEMEETGKPLDAFLIPA